MNGRFIAGLCVLLIGLALCAAGFGLLVRLAEYQAVTQIKIEPDVVSDVGSPSGDGVYQPYDPYFFETELKVIASDRVLKNVAQSLSLDEKWGNRYGNGGTISTDEAIKRLRRMISLDADRNQRYRGKSGRSGANCQCGRHGLSRLSNRPLQTRNDRRN